MGDIEDLLGDLVRLEVLVDHAHGLATGHVIALFVEPVLNASEFAFEGSSDALKRCHMDFAVVLFEYTAGVSEVVEGHVGHVLDLPPPLSAELFAA